MNTLAWLGALVPLLAVACGGIAVIDGDGSGAAGGATSSSSSASSSGGGGSGTVELCNGIDDDDDPATPDGSGDPAYLSDCSGTTAPCGDSIMQCRNGAWSCESTTAPLLASFELFQAPGGQDPYFSDVAFDGTAFVVVIGNQTDTRWARVAPDGSILVAPQVVDAELGSRVAIASLGQGEAVVLTHSHEAGPLRSLHIAADGAVLQHHTVDTFDDLRGVALTAHGAGYLALWERHPSYGGSVRAMTLAADGAPSGPAFDLNDPSAAAGNSLSLAVVSADFGAAAWWPLDGAFQGQALSPSGEPMGMPVTTAGLTQPMVTAAPLVDSVVLGLVDFDAAFVQHVGPGGQPLAGPVSLGPAQAQANIAAASLGSDAALVWHEQAAGLDDGFYLARVRPPATLCFKMLLVCNDESSTTLYPGPAAIARASASTLGMVWRRGVDAVQFTAVDLTDPAFPPCP